MSNVAVHEDEYRGFSIKILLDEDGEAANPITNNDMLGKQVYWHGRYNLGHCYKDTKRLSPEEWLEREANEGVYELWQKKHSKRLGYSGYLMELFQENNLVIFVQCYEHGQISLSATGIRPGWDSFDSGLLGFVYVSHESIQKEYGVKRLTKKTLERAKSVLLEEVKEYDSYLRGEVYGYCIEDENGEELSSCWGFLGDYSYCLECAKSDADYWAEEK